MKKYLLVILFALLIISGCGDDLETRQGKEIVAAVFDYDRNQPTPIISFERQKGNALVYEKEKQFIVVLESEQSEAKGKTKHWRILYTVAKHAPTFSASRSDVKRVYDEKLVEKAALFYEEKNITIKK